MIAALPQHTWRRWAAVLAANAVLVGLCLSAQSSTAGFTARVINGTTTAATAPYFTCAGAQTPDFATAMFAFKLDEAAGSTVAIDSSGKGAVGTYVGSMASRTGTVLNPVACPRDTTGAPAVGRAYVLNGTTSYLTTLALSGNANSFTVEAWFRTSVAAGVIIGQVDTAAAASPIDHVLYVNSAGRIGFGSVYSGQRIKAAVTSPKVYTDGLWHHAAGTVGTGGMILYMDGVQVAIDPARTTSDNGKTPWRLGYADLTGWPSAPTSPRFNGELRFAAAYTSVLTPANVSARHSAG